jgi:GMP synthase (glutamine-hydrolysing)
MRVLAIVHQRDAGPGVFGEEMRARGVDLDEWLIAGHPNPPDNPAGYDAVMTFGGAMNAHDEDKHPWLRREKELLAELLEAGKPVLGACLGTQLLVEAAGGEVRRASEPEIGWHRVSITSEAKGDSLIGSQDFEAFQWHSYEAIPPNGAVRLASSDVCTQAYRIGERAWGIQFHAEVSAAGVEKWLDEWDEDPDAVRIGLDPAALRAETREKIAAWNLFGRELCGRFLDAVGPTPG